MDETTKGKKKFSMSYCNVPRTVTPEYKTIPDCLRYWSEVHPDKEAVVFLSASKARTSVTFKDVYTNSLRFAHALKNNGLQKQETVGMNIPNSAEFLYAMFGTMMAEGIPISISFTYSDGSDVIALLNKLKTCRTVVLDPGENNKNWKIFQHVVENVGPDGTTVSASIPTLKKVIFTRYPSGFENGIDVPTMLTEVQFNTELPTLDPDDIAILFQTSGSTGMPKAVAHTHYSLLYGISMGDWTPDSAQIIYNERQFGWGGGFPHNILTGNTLVTRSLQSDNAVDGTDFVLEAVRNERCSRIFALPPVLRELILREEKVRSDWQVASIITGGQPVVRFYASCAGTLCKTFAIGYGSTEALGPCYGAATKTDDFQDYYCGQVTPGVEIKFVDESGHVVPVNTTGELWVRGPNIFLCYFNDEGKTNEVKTRTGWYKTDDIGYMTENGTVFMLGRKSDVIISGGLNVVPSVLESLLNSIEGIKDACVVPIPHPTLFQVICACLLKTESSNLTEREVREYIEGIHADKARAYTVVPTHYLFFERFPQTQTGKVSRKLLATEANKKVNNE